MLTSLLLAFTGGVGVLMVFLALASRRMGGGLERVARLSGAPRPGREAPPLPDERPFLTLHRRGLAAAVAQADLPVTPSGFVRFGLIASFSAFALAYLLTGALLASVLVGVLGCLLYVQWLLWRRDAKRLEYEEALADLCDRLGAGALLTNSLKGALSHAAELAPEIVREDARYLASQITAGAGVGAAFGEVRRRRRSVSLDLLADTLAVWAGRGAAVPLHAILDPLSLTIREMAGERKRMQTELSGVRAQLMLVALAPLLFVALLRSASPTMAGIYASAVGQLIQSAAYLIAAAGFLAGQRALAGVARVLEIEAL